MKKKLTAKERDDKRIAEANAKALKKLTTKVRDRLCPNPHREPFFDPKTISVQWEKKQHHITGDGVVECEQCGEMWCCWGCAVECDVLDHKYFDMIYDDKGEAPEVYKIVCCKCSGADPSWKDRK